MMRLLPIIALLGCASHQAASILAQPVNHLAASVPAFPGAEGFGKYTTGGRGGAVLVVSNLTDEGPGSFRAAAEKKGKRIIVFAVDGTIHLLKPLSIKGDATIAGQTAPGAGICIADQPVSLGGNNIVVRYLRFRMGDRYQSQKGKVDGSGADDAFGGTRRTNIIIDHCSISWSTDELFSVYGGDSTTLQWNLLAEPLNYSYHFETGDTDFERHGYGGIWGGAHLSAHHNLFAHCISRTPRFNGTRLGAATELVDYRNNVIYNWGGNNVYGGEGGKYNVVGNYYKPGPGTSKKALARIVNPTRNETVGFGKFYVAENVVEGSPEGALNNRNGIHIGDGKDAFSADTIIMNSAFDVIPLAAHTATKAYTNVLQWAGASLQRDSLDERLVNEVKTGRGNFIDVQGGLAHGTVYEQTTSAWPFLKPGKVLLDSDSDGMPDAWETKNGLNPADPKDAAFFTISKSYTNIEVYCNGLLATIQ
jgi:pectate lyase